MKNWQKQKKQMKGENEREAKRERQRERVKDREGKRESMRTLKYFAQDEEKQTQSYFFFSPVSFYLLTYFFNAADQTNSTGHSFPISQVK